MTFLYSILANYMRNLVCYALLNAYFCDLKLGFTVHVCNSVLEF